MNINIKLPKLISLMTHTELLSNLSQVILVLGQFGDFKICIFCFDDFIIVLQIYSYYAA